MKSRPDILLTMVLGAALFLLILSGQAAVFAEEPLKAEILARADMAGDQITLGDIAVFSGPDCALKNDLAQVYITASPAPGQSTTLRIAYLEYRLKAAGLPLEQVEWTVPEQVYVERKSQTLDEQWLRGVVENHLGGLEPYKSAEWKLLDIRTSGLPALPAGQLEYRVSENSTSNPTYVNLSIYFSVDGKEAGSIRVNGRTEVSLDALVAATRLEKGRLIAESDLTMGKVNYNDLKGGALTGPEQAIGQVARRRIDVGQAITSRDLENPTAVRRGDMVIIVAQSGPMKISTTGQAKRDGAVGDSIPVVNTSSNKTIVATVVNSNVVSVNF